MASIDPSQKASLSTLPPTGITGHAEMTKEEVHQAIGSLSQLMHKLTDCVLHLTSQVTLLATNIPAAAAAAATPVHPKTKYNMKRPESWKGKGSSADARYFLATFSNWAFHMEDQLNDWNTTHNNWVCNDGRWIQTVLNLMDEDACIWVLPHLETLRNRTIPFGQNWQQFKRGFIK